jgi:hypothetical protein
MERNDVTTLFLCSHRNTLQVLRLQVDGEDIERLEARGLKGPSVL